MSEEHKTAQAPGWERETLEKVLLASVEEQRRARRWSIFFKFALLAYIGIIIALAMDWKENAFDSVSKSSGHTAVIDVAGQIVEGSETNADNIIEGLRAAAKDKNTKGVVLRMNTPGGSPVQSAYVWEEIRRLKRDKPNLPIYAVVVDLCASGGYYIASAADKIFVNRSSVIGSIGVIMNGFGFVDAMGRLGVERRLLTAGDHKALLDPFSPVNPEEQAHIKVLLSNIHQQFIDSVKQGRGERLKESPEMFSGLVWTGEEAIKLGLADDMGDVRSVAKEVIHAEETVNFTPRERLLERLSHRVGASLGHTLSQALGLNLELR
jgi:protease-4